MELGELETPQFLFLDKTAEGLFARAAERSHRLSTNAVQVVSGYSIKTNPDERLIRLALENGFYAECISLAEAHKAIEVGFRADQLILNGPGKWWPQGMMPKARMHAVFCDSVADLDRCVSAIEPARCRRSMSASGSELPTSPPASESRSTAPRRSRS